MTPDELRRAGEHLIALANRGVEHETLTFPTGDDSEDPVQIVIEPTGYAYADRVYRWRAGENEGLAGGRDAAIFWAGYWHRDLEIGRE